jgi:hypothetical protein
MIQLFRAAQIVGWGVTGENLQPLPPFLMSLHHSIEGQMYYPPLGKEEKASNYGGGYVLDQICVYIAILKTGLN